jgi:hypothetical protein
MRLCRRRATTRIESTAGVARRSGGGLVTRIRIVCETAGLEATATLNDSATARALYEALPIDATAQRWGSEVYFTVPVHVGAEDPAERVAVGDIGYWPPGPAFCIFFGQQPISAVNPLGSVDGDAWAFEAVDEGYPIRLEAAGG